MELILSVLPADRKGYMEAREFVEAAHVLGEGRRGPGNLVLGIRAEPADVSGPTAPVLAAGAVETTRGPYTITVRERVANQMDVEILSERGEEIPDHFEEKRHWTYASWFPGQPSPATGAPVREVRIRGGHTLGICCAEHRVWLIDGDTGIVHPIPITNFYNALMLHRGIRDPRIALHSSLFFEQTDAYNDGDLEAAFLAYNTARPRVAVPPPAGQPATRGLTGTLRRYFGGGSSRERQ
jgi:hypothetical protein